MITFSSLKVGPHPNNDKCNQQYVDHVSILLTCMGFPFFYTLLVEAPSLLCISDKTHPGGRGTQHTPLALPSSRQFSSMLVLVGRVTSATSFDPTYAAIIQNKDRTWALDSKWFKAIYQKSHRVGDWKPIALETKGSRACMGVWVVFILGWPGKMSSVQW